MSDGDGRVSWEILAQKFLVAGFLKAQLSTDVLKKFEDEVARGREYANSYVVHIDHTVRPKATTEDLHAICLKYFCAPENPYYPYFWVVLDERTAVDGTVIVQNDRRPDYDRKAGEPPEEMRVTPASIQTLLACLDITHLTILDILVNDRPDDDVDTWFYDVPFDHSNLQQNARVPFSEFETSKDLSDDFTILRLDDVSKKVPEFPSCKVEIYWFGKLPENILLQTIENERPNGSVKLVTYAK